MPLADTIADRDVLIEWVSVDERLPELDQNEGSESRRVLLATFASVVIGTLSRDAGWCSSGHRAFGVTYWAELPGVPEDATERAGRQTLS